MGFYSFPASAATQNPKVTHSDSTRTTRTGTTYTTHNTYTGLSLSADDVLRITVHWDTGGNRPNLRLTYGDGTNTDVGSEIRADHTNGTRSSGGTTIILVRQADTSTTGTLQESAITFGYVDGSTMQQEVGAVTLTNVTSFDSITQILLEANNTSSSATDINKVVIEQLTTEGT